MIEKAEAQTKECDVNTQTNDHGEKHYLGLELRVKTYWTKLESILFLEVTSYVHGSNTQNMKKILHDLKTAEKKWNKNGEKHGGITVSLSLTRKDHPLSENAPKAILYPFASYNEDPEYFIAKIIHAAADRLEMDIRQLK